MTAPTPIPDAAVEAYLLAEHTAWRDQAPPVIDGSVTIASAVQAARVATRAGLAAALPHLLPAAPSGETAPLHVPLGQVYADGRWVEVVAPAPACGEVAAASVPARTNAAATPAYCRPPRPCPIPEATPDEVEIEAWQNYDGPNAEHRISQGEHAGPPHARIQVRHRCGWSISFGMGTLQWGRVEGEVNGHFGISKWLAAAPPGETTAPQPACWRIPPDPGPSVTRVRDDSGNHWVRHPRAADDEHQWMPEGGDPEDPADDVWWINLVDLHGPLYDATPAGEQPTTEPAGEVDRG